MRVVGAAGWHKGGGRARGRLLAGQPRLSAARWPPSRHRNAAVHTHALLACRLLPYGVLPGGLLSAKRPGAADKGRAPQARAPIGLQASERVRTPGPQPP